MNKKNIATTMATLLCACLFIVIGSCFSAFLYKNEKPRFRMKTRSRYRMSSFSLPSPAGWAWREWHRGGWW